MIGDRPLTLRRATSSEWASDGRPDVVTDDLPIVGSLQPASGKVMQDTGAGRRARVALVLRTHQDVRTADAVGDEHADSVIVDGEEFVATEVLSWSSMLQVREVLLVRSVEDGAESAA